MTFFQALLLGLIQGLTEFLPVSSSGHLAITQHFLPGFKQPGLLFDVLLHFGTMLAVAIYFRRELVRLALAWFRPGAEAQTDRRILTLLLLASLPTAVIGLSFKDFFEQSFDNLPLIAAMLVVTGTLLFLSERFRKPGRTEEALTFSDALVVGIVQGLAIIPGISRSGSTIAALLLKGVDGETAARFSFLLALPAVAGATLLQLRHLEQLPGTEALPYLAGTVTAFVVGLAAIHMLMLVVKRKRLTFFAVYCWLAGGLLFLAL